MEIENHIGHLLTGLWDYKKSSADMYKLYRLLEACKALACRYHSYANHLQGGVDFANTTAARTQNILNSIPTRFMRPSAVCSIQE